MRVLYLLCLFGLSLAVVSCGGLGTGAARTRQTLQIAVNDLLWVPQRNRLYVSVPSSQWNGNQIAVIAPGTFKVSAYIPVGMNPNKMAVSDDGTTLFVGLDDEFAVRKVDLLTNTASTKWQLTDGFSGGKTLDLSVMPGSHDTVAVAYYSPFSFWSRLRVFDDGVERPDGPNDFIGYCRFGTSPTRLYAIQAAVLRHYDVGPTGLALTSEVPLDNPLLGQRNYFDSGHIVTAYGQVFDAESGVLEGSYAGIQDLGLALSANLDRVYGIAGSLLLVFQKATYAKLGEISLGPNFQHPHFLESMGTFGVAVYSDVGGGLTVFRNPP